jgi:hypothetical protein
LNALKKTSLKVAEISRPALAEILQAPADKLAAIDIAIMNLRCAEGLPGAPDLNIEACLATLQEWAEQVRANTERHRNRLNDPRYAAHYQNSEIYFRCELLLQTLQENCGVRYNPDLVDSQTGLAKQWPFVDSRDFFLNGILGPRRSGSCSSMPVLYVAVGRRLGYPLKLVTTADHVFVRWDDGTNRLNIEGSGAGFSSFPDDHYKLWPRKISDSEIAANGYLRSLSPPEELAFFMSMRGHCFTDTARPADAQAAYGEAHRLAPLMYQAIAADPTESKVREMIQNHGRASQKATSDILARQAREMQQLIQPPAETVGGMPSISPGFPNAGASPANSKWRTP